MGMVNIEKAGSCPKSEGEWIGGSLFVLGKILINKKDCVSMYT